MLSICTTVKNRSRVNVEDKTLFLFPNCIESLADSLSLGDNVELIVADWNSTDWPIRDWITEKIPHIPIHIINIKSDSFSAGKGRNIAADKAHGEVLFFMDADMIVNKEVIQQGLREAMAGKVFYPTVKYEVDKSGKLIIHEGGGNLFVNKETFKKSGGWPEYWKHGFEDTDFAVTLKKATEVVTNPDTHILHQWHPQTSLFKNAHAKIDDKIVEERRKYYQKRQDAEKDILLKAIGNMLNSPDTTHSKLNRPARGSNGPMAI